MVNGADAHFMGAANAAFTIPEQRGAIFAKRSRAVARALAARRDGAGQRAAPGNGGPSR